MSELIPPALKCALCRTKTGIVRVKSRVHLCEDCVGRTPPHPSRQKPRNVQCSLCLTTWRATEAPGLTECPDCGHVPHEY